MQMAEIQMMEHMQSLTEDRRPAFQVAWNSQRKDPGTALLLGLLCLFGISGVGRMYAGEVGLGVAQLLLGPLTCYIWPLVDLFFVKDAVERTNLDVLMKLKMAFPVEE